MTTEQLEKMQKEAIEKANLLAELIKKKKTVEIEESLVSREINLATTQKKYRSLIIEQTANGIKATRTIPIGTKDSSGNDIDTTFSFTFNRIESHEAYQKAVDNFLLDVQAMLISEQADLEVEINNLTA